MQRKHISRAGGKTFFEKFGNGINAVQNEVDKLEHITKDLKTGQTLDPTYFADDLKLLQNVNTVYKDALHLYTTVSEQPVNIDPIEARLQAIREKLIKLEENPQLLKRGYKPFVPPNRVETPPVDSADVSATELNFTSPIGEPTNCTELAFASPLSTSSFEKGFNTELVTPKKITESMSSLSISKSDTLSTYAYAETATVLKKKPSDPKIATCIKILQRWKTVGEEEDKLGIIKSNVASPSDIPRSTTSVVPSVLAKRQLPTPMPKFKPRTAITVTANSQPDNATSEYETVEFTPGMTSKVRRK